MEIPVSKTFFTRKIRKRARKKRQKRHGKVSKVFKKLTPNKTQKINLSGTSFGKSFLFYGVLHSYILETKMPNV